MLPKFMGGLYYVRIWGLDFDFLRFWSKVPGLSYKNFQDPGQNPRFPLKKWSKMVTHKISRFWTLKFSGFFVFETDPMDYPTKISGPHVEVPQKWTKMVQNSTRCFGVFFAF